MPHPRILKKDLLKRKLCRLRQEGRRVSDEVLGVAYDRLMDSSFGLEMGATPKAMADMVESLAGAVFVDNGFRLEPAFQVIRRPNNSFHASANQL